MRLIIFPIPNSPPGKLGNWEVSRESVLIVLIYILTYMECLWSIKISLMIKSSIFLKNTQFSFMHSCLPKYFWQNLLLARSKIWNFVILLLFIYIYHANFNHHRNWNQIAMNNQGRCKFQSTYLWPIDWITSGVKDLFSLQI